jgi:hypothetical protein
MPRSWQDRLDHCLTEAEVLDLARRFLAQFSPYELAALPAACRPGTLNEGNDIAEYAVRVVDHRCDNGEEHDYTVHRLNDFFSTAAKRLTKISVEL